MKSNARSTIFERRGSGQLSIGGKQKSHKRAMRYGFSTTHEAGIRKGSVCFARRRKRLV